jgi:ribosomal protein S27E
MKLGQWVGGVVSVLAGIGMMAAAVGCAGIPKGTKEDVSLGATVTVHATGAGIIKADTEKTTFKIKCSLCGYESEAITIDTPAMGKPHVLKWVCPKCGHKQTITVQVN